jgi:hypothetical protein
MSSSGCPAHMTEQVQKNRCVHMSNLRRAIALDLYSSVGAARTIKTFQWTRRYDCFESCHARAAILYYLYTSKNTRALQQVAIHF